MQLLSLLKSKKNRRYNVFISTKSTDDLEPILFKYLSFDAQVGILAHELGHTFYYEKHSVWQIIKFAIQYLINGNFRGTHEKTTDALVVYKGLGWPVYRYAHFIRNSETTKEMMESGGLSFMEKFYLSEEELLEIMRKLPDYGVE